MKSFLYLTIACSFLFSGCLVEKPPATIVEEDPFRNIRNGDFTFRPDYQDIVRIRWVDQGNCTATMVGPAVAITAAHCVVSAVRMAEANEVYAKNTAGERVFANAIQVHPDFSYVYETVASPVQFTEFIVRVSADLALIRFSESLGWIPRRIAENPLPFPEVFSIVGFGRDENNVSGVKKDGKAFAVAKFSTFSGPLGNRVEAVADGTIISVPEGDDQIVCPGDSGGPMVNAGRRLAAVASAVVFENRNDVCNTAVSSTHISVFAFRGWINTTLDDLQDGMVLYAWHNSVKNTDTNNDGVITEADAQGVIDFLNAKFAGAGRFDPYTEPTGYYDTNDDGQITPIDALLVINDLNR